MSVIKNTLLKLIKIFSAILLLMLFANLPVRGEDLTSISTEDLVTRLTEESAEGIGSQTTAWASAFLAINDEPRFRGGIMGSAKPVASPIMRELVGRGVAALPVLLDHLADARSTKLTVGQGFAGKWYSDEYSARSARPSGNNAVNTRKEVSFESYTLRVGDLCYIAIGQIVNRPLLAVRYQPSLCLVVNSPLESPALAAAVKNDWNGLTAADHQLSLEQDAINPRIFTPGDALKRLTFYYPAVGERLTLKMLQRPFYDRRVASHFFEKTLGGSAAADWDKLISQSRAKNGEASYWGVLQCALAAWHFPEGQMDDQRWRLKKLGSAVIEHCFPKSDPEQAAFIDATDIFAQKYLIEDLSALHLPSVDEAILLVLQRTSAMPPPSHPEDKFAQCDLAMVCAKRLAKRADYNQRASALLEEIISKFKAARNSADEAESADLKKNVEYLQATLLATKAGHVSE